MRISVYITSYNNGWFLREAIESVLAQTFKPFEIIIVDDCSTDGSREMILSFKNKYPDLIRAVFQDVNKGVTQCRIDALNLCEGDYVTYVDGDDLYLPEKLACEADLVRNHHADIAFSNYYRIKADHENTILSIWAYDRSQLPAFGNMYLEVFVKSFPRNSLFRCELVDKKLLERTGYHDRKLEIYEDFEFKIRLASMGKIVYTMLPLHMYRDNPQGLSKSKKSLHLASYEYIYAKHFPTVLKQFPDKAKSVKVKYLKMMDEFRDLSGSKKSFRFLLKQVKKGL